MTVILEERGRVRTKADSGLGELFPLRDLGNTHCCGGLPWLAMMSSFQGRKTQQCTNIANIIVNLLAVAFPTVPRSDRLRLPKRDPNIRRRPSSPKLHSTLGMYVIIELWAT